MDIGNDLQDVQNTLDSIDATVLQLQSTISSVDSILQLVYSFLNPGTTKEAIEHFTQILKTVVFTVVVLVSGLLSFLVSGVVGTILPVRRPFFFVIFLASIIGVFGSLLLLAKLFVLDELESSGNELADAILNNSPEESMF